MLKFQKECGYNVAKRELARDLQIVESVFHTDPWWSERVYNKIIAEVEGERKRCLLTLLRGEVIETAYNAKYKKHPNERAAGKDSNEDDDIFIFQEEPSEPPAKRIRLSCQDIDD